MKKYLLGLGIAAFIAVPLFASAEMTSGSMTLEGLYTQLIALLNQELTLLKASAASAPATAASLSISPNTGPAPLMVTYTVTNPEGDESLDYGDGHSTGSMGCTRNEKGFCLFTSPVNHYYQLPGTYKISLCDKGKDLHLIATTSVTVTVK